MRMKKIVALALALMLALSMAACGTKDTSWVAKAGDDVIAPGIYLTFLMTGVNDASTKAADPEKPLEGEIDGVPADQYVVEYAKREVTKYLGAAAQYRALGLRDRLASMGEEEQLDILASDGMLVRRPVLVWENGVLLGFREAEWQEALEGHTEG